MLARQYFFVVVYRFIVLFVILKVWTLILLTAFAVVVFMSLFAKVSHHLPDATNDILVTNNQQPKNMFHHACTYLIYVLNVMTNQGKIFN